jgi:hypothetical protein
MIISYHREDYIEVDELWLRANENVIQKKIHLVKICFVKPTEDKLDQLLYILPKTNRFIIDSNVKIYNDYFKKTKKKFYVENTYKDEAKFVSFLRKNNKILIDFTKFTSSNLKYVLYELIWEDLLSNIEIIKMDKISFELYKEHLMNWDGNIILMSE